MRVDQTRTSSVQSNSESESAKGASGAKKSGRAALIEQGKKSKEASSTGESARSGDVRADISPRAKEFSRAKAVAMDAPEVRESRVAELKQRIADGKYNVDAKAVADRMVDEHLSSGLD